MLSKNRYKYEIESPSLVVVAGRPGMGLTTLGLSWNNFSGKGSKGYFISLYTRLDELEKEYWETHQTIANHSVIKYDSIHRLFTIK